MKKPLSVTIGSLAATACLFCTSAFAAHFTVGGSNNGSFTIAGSLYFGETLGPSLPISFYPDHQSDADNPVDDGLPVTIWPNYDTTTTQYQCDVTMQGVVTNGIASINSVNLVGTTKVCFNIASYLRAGGHLPWRFHALSQPGSYTAMLENISFYSPALFQCPNVSATVNIGGGYASFNQPGPGGCFMEDSGNDLTVTPSLDVVYP